MCIRDRLYAERAKTKGYAFSPDSEWQREFEERFEYEETDDQLQCIQEIKQDMETPRPMERLLCGDVGFGKTEVALRAAFKCVLDGKQCAFLCPTTILAWQHLSLIHISCLLGRRSHRADGGRRSGHANSAGHNLKRENRRWGGLHYRPKQSHPGQYCGRPLRDQRKPGLPKRDPQRGAHWAVLSDPPPL